MQGPIERAMGEEIMEAFKNLKIGMTRGTSEVHAEMILASADFDETLQENARWKMNASKLDYSVEFPIFKEKCDIINCGMYGGAKLLEHAMKIVERVLKKNCSDG